MNKVIKVLFLLSLSSVLLLSGCRRKPVEQTEQQTEKQTETETEKVTETEKQTEKETETEKQTQKQTERQTQKSTEKQTEKPAATQNKQTESNKKTVTPTNPTTPSAAGTGGQCPYCYGTFDASEYAEHVAAEEAYIEYMKSQGVYMETAPAQTPNNGYDTGNNTGYDTGSAQCPYCYGFFSTDSTYGYSEYSQHLAAEEANSYQDSAVEYTQCPYCGLWIDPYSYQDHITYGY